MNRIAKFSPRLALAALPAAAFALIVLAGSLVDARQDGSWIRDGGVVFEDDPALAFVDPVITGPVSPQYELVRRQAGCDEAVWPTIPSVCYPR